MRKAFVILALFMGSCTTRPYSEPVNSWAKQFPHAPFKESNKIIAEKWWEDFNDANLNSLIEQVKANNSDIKIAILNLQKAQELVKIAKLNRGALFSGNIGASASNDSNNFNANLQTSYQLDLNHKLSEAQNVARFEVIATDEDRQAITLSLIGSVCELYWNIGFVHQQIDSNQTSLEYQKKLLQIVKKQHDAGAVSGIEYAEALQSVAAQSVKLDVLAQQLVEYRANLSIIAGVQSQVNFVELSALPNKTYYEIPAGLPASLLSQRPDLRAASARLKAQFANLNITRAQIYPDLSLTASGGGSSNALRNLFSNPIGTISAAISLPFLDHERLKIQSKIGQIDYDIAVVNYKQSMVKAFFDVDNALSNRTQLAKQAQNLRTEIDAANRVERLYAIRYKNGAIALRIWLNSQESARATQLAYENVRLEQLINQSKIYQALGGGTKPTFID